MRIPPRARPNHRTTAGRSLVLIGAVACLAAASTLANGSGPAGATTVSMAATKTVTVTWRGNGHGHGLSQYGARGAAEAGLSYRRIIAFYYPHTTLAKVAQPIIRVLVAGYGDTVAVLPTPGLHVVGQKRAITKSLPTAGISRYRLIADGHRGLTLQQGRSGKGYVNYRTGLPNGAAFSGAAGQTVREFAPDGSSNLYHGWVRALRTTASGRSTVRSVNVIGLERYTAGVAPREMPASWARAAVDAQAIAARTYATYALDHPRNTGWDICDTTACQFYGGAAYLNRAGTVVWREDLHGTQDTAGLVATYRGKAIFSQFSASNGGWTVDGGQPYLVAKADPYDNVASGDPYLDMTNTVSTASLARTYGLSKLTRIAMATDGHGTWGGRSTQGYVYGVRAGKPVRVATTGFALADALGASTDWYQLVAK